MSRISNNATVENERLKGELATANWRLSRVDHNFNDAMARLGLLEVKLAIEKKIKLNLKVELT